MGFHCIGIVEPEIIRNCEKSIFSRNKKLWNYHAEHWGHG